MEKSKKLVLIEILLHISTRIVFKITSSTREIEKIM